MDVLVLGVLGLAVLGLLVLVLVGLVNVVAVLAAVGTLPFSMAVVGVVRLSRKARLYLARHWP